MSKRTLSGTYVPANPEPPKRLCTPTSPGEVILYKIPPAEHTLFVCRLHPDTTEEELEEAFSPFGLLYEVRCYMRDGDGGGESSQASQATPGPSASQEPSPTLLNKFAFVRFYSYFSALTAKQDVNDRKFHGARCKVTFSKLKGEDKYGGSNALPLTMRRSTELTNYYFGYDGWSSRLVALAPETPIASLVPDPKTRLYKCVYKCVIHLSFHTQDRELEALGLLLDLTFFPYCCFFLHCKADNGAPPKKDSERRNRTAKERQ
ncbi:RAD52 motif-containing protein [Balamuthia mandrillaris]